LASGTTFGDASGGCAVTGTWLDGIRPAIQAMLSRERVANSKTMRMTETLVYECMGNLVQLAWSSQSSKGGHGGSGSGGSGSGGGSGGALNGTSTGGAVFRAPLSTSST